MKSDNLKFHFILLVKNKKSKYFFVTSTFAI